ncbi:hypothetical protein [Nonomuraea rubra]|uniref:hypothetical protein n=1 Tax=Nonomuraea rubra TaxID=46180 RepID=UPI0031E6590B
MRARPMPYGCAERAFPVSAVRYQGVIHGFLTLNALRGTCSAQEAIEQAASFLARALGTGRS